MNLIHQHFSFMANKQTQTTLRLWTRTFQVAFTRFAKMVRWPDHKTLKLDSIDWVMAQTHCANRNPVDATVQADRNFERHRELEEQHVSRLFDHWLDTSSLHVQFLSLKSQDLRFHERTYCKYQRQSQEAVVHQNQCRNDLNQLLQIPRIDTHCN